MTPIRVLIANRGEAACRIIRTFSRLGIETIAVYSEADRKSLFVEAADHAYEIGPAVASQSYLDLDQIIAAGQELQANALHPGWGFLSENPQLAKAVEAQGWLYLGPTAQQAELMGDKTRARSLALTAKVPCTPCWVPPSNLPANDPQWLAEAMTIGLPLLVKATSGGGGKGMRIVRDSKDLSTSIESARREAGASFADESVFLEKLIEPARHIEVQVIGDGNKQVAILGDRECSWQRRHQKLIEEAPAPELPIDLRHEIHQAARRLATSVQYRGVGTVEFLLDESGSFYFLEMNTRLQVEHPVTEEIFGIDLVELQWLIASGAGLPPELVKKDTDGKTPRGHAIEIRVNAEDPAADFLPSIGVLTDCIWPQGEGIRVDSGVRLHDTITSHYDPMMAKIIAWGETREEAKTRLIEALDGTLISGVSTTIPFCRELLLSPEFSAIQVHTTLVEKKWSQWQPPQLEESWRSALRMVSNQLLGSSTPPNKHGDLRIDCWNTITGRNFP
ncbi:MAG: biotin carboxylase N-terminal domain-containing protein [Planctomycetota bacterium]